MMELEPVAPAGFQALHVHVLGGPMRLTLAVVISTFSLATFSGAIYAQGLPKSGSIHFLAGLGSAYTEVEVAEKRQQGTVLDNGVTYNQKGSGPLHVGSVHCATAYMLLEGAGVFKGYCTWGDGDGDKIFTQFDGAGTPDGKSDGKHQITGGTGKYSGIQGGGPFKCIGVSRFGTSCEQRFEYRLP
jgi:hypothetical protein